MADAATIATALNGKRTGNEWVCPCPAHDDQYPSLSIAEKNGKLLLHCHAGCTQENVISALLSRGLWPKKGNVMSNPSATTAESEAERETKEKRWRLLESFWRTMAYASEQPVKYLEGRGIEFVPSCARLLCETDSKRLTGYGLPAMVVPITDGERLRGAHITFLTKDGASKADIETPRRMYGEVKGAWVQLGKLDPDKPLIVGEGIESTLSAMQVAGCPGIATLSASFMPAIKLPHHRDIIIAADNDEAGRNAATALAVRLANEGRKVRIAVPAKPRGFEGSGYDWNDALQHGNAMEAWQEALSRSPADIMDRPIMALTEQEFMAQSFPKREALLDPWLPRAGLVMVHAPRGEGKTWFILAVGKAVAAGANLLGWTGRTNARVLYVDGELPGEFLQKRLRMFEESPPDYFRILCRDFYHLQQQMMPDLGTAEGRLELNRIITQCHAEVVILDSISTLVRSGIENEAESWAPIQDWLMQHRWHGRTIILVHHEGRSGNPRGSSKREDVLDTMIRLRKQSNDDVTGTEEVESAFALEFTKHRDFYGKDAAPMVLHLNTSQGLAVWTHELARDAQGERIKKLLDAGMKQKEIAEELDITPGRVSQLVKKLKTAGKVIQLPERGGSRRDEVDEE